VGVSRDCQNFLSTPIISGTGKATNFQLYARSWYRSEQTPITNYGKSSRGLVRTLEIFRGTHILGALHGRLCDSSVSLLLM